MTVLPEARLHAAAEWSFALADLPPREPERDVLLCDPAYYEIGEPVNPHMRTAAGARRKVDRRAAWEQWEALGAAYARLGFRVHVIGSARGLADMVFAANPVLPLTDAEGRRSVVLSRMRHAARRPEVARYAAWFKERGFRAVELPGDEALTFEGGGDGLLVPGRRAILAGIGPRTTEAALRALAPLAGMPVIGLRLPDERFYHLDTCLSLLDERTALFAPDGLEAAGRALVERLFPRVIAAPLEEADSPGLACNAHCPDGRHVLIQRGNDRTCAALSKAGFEPIELDTSEFVKSGGSVFCLKSMVP